MHLGKKIKSRKAAGFDEIPAEVLKTRLYNAVKTKYKR